MPLIQNACFSRDSLGFLQSLADNNNRDWFNANKQQYEDYVRTPALDFIEDMEPELWNVAPNFIAVAKKTGGSLMRVYRDTRFSKDKTPYKTNVGIHFRHSAGKNVHAPGFYVHVGLDGIFLGAGIWRPDSTALGKIRDAIVDKPTEWQAARDDSLFRKYFDLRGESLKNAPRGYPKDHALITDLKRKDFIAASNLDVSDILSPELVETTAKRYKSAVPFMRFLCDALGLAY